MSSFSVAEKSENFSLPLLMLFYVFRVENDSRELGRFSVTEKSEILSLPFTMRPDLSV